MRYSSWLIGFMVVNYFLMGSTTINGSENSEFVRYDEKIPGSDISINMVPITGGTFLMGSPTTEVGRKNDEGPEKEVKINSFWMGAYEITWEQYSQFLD